MTAEILATVAWERNIRGRYIQSETASGADSEGNVYKNGTRYTYNEQRWLTEQSVPLTGMML